MSPDQAPEPAPLATVWHVPFWRRIGAFAGDSFFLGAPVLMLGLVFFDQAAKLGQAGRLIGFVLALVYFVTFTSGLGGSQTPGQHLFGIRVVDLSGRGLTLSRAAIRFGVLAMPIFINGLTLSSGSPLLTTVLWLGYFGIGGGIVYMFIFNRPTRRSLHDLAAGSVVVEETPQVLSCDRTTPRVHLIVVGCWCALIAIAPWAVSLREATPDDLARSAALQGLRSELTRKLDIHRIAVSMGSTKLASLTGGVSTVSFLAVTVWPDANPESSADIERRVAGTVLAAHLDLLGNRRLIVRVQRGFDLGVASWSSVEFDALDAAGWQHALGEATQ